MTTNLKDLKLKFLELLKKDEEFKYAVIGLVGLDRVFEELRKLREDLNKLREDFNRLYEKSLEHDKRFEEVISRLNRVELELGALNEAFYCRSLWEDLREEIRGRGEKILYRKRNARVDDEDIDLLMVTDKRVYVVEVKVKPKHEDEGRLLAKADVVKKHYKDKEVVAILAGSMIGREIEEYANEKNVLVYSY